MALYSKDEIKKIKEWHIKIEDVYEDFCATKTDTDLAFEAFGIWLDNPENTKHRKRGLRKGRISHCRKVIGESYQAITENFGSRPHDAKEVSRMLKKAAHFEEAFIAYTNPSNDDLNNSNKGHHINDINNVDFDWKVPRSKKLNLNDVDLDECTLWFFYYLDLRSDKVKSPPKIGRAIAQVFRGDKVHFFNVPGNNNQNYSGRWYGVDERAYSFNLRNSGKSRHLHLKVHFKQGYQIVSGNYTTYDSNRIYSGKFIGEKITKSVIKEIKKNSKSQDGVVLTTALFDYRQSFPDGGYALNEHIFEFLSERHRNYLLVPEPRIDLEDFKDLLIKRSPTYTREKRERWYVDYKKPKMFIATPQTALIKHEDDEDELIKRIEKKHKAINVLIKGISQKAPNIEVIQEETTKESKEEADTFDNLNVIRKVRYFVLILGDVNKATFSMVQLGWALSYCKHVIIFYKEGNISNRLMSLEELDIDMVSYNSLTTDLEKMILPRIVKFVRDRDKKLT